MTPVKQCALLPAKLYFIGTRMTRRGLAYQSALASEFWQEDKIGNHIGENQLFVAGLHLLGLQTL